MNKTLIRRFLAMAAVLILAAIEARARDLEIFRASRHGDWMWEWGQARVKRIGPDLVFQENNPQGGYGDAFTGSRFPYFADGVVDLDVRKVTGGAYVMQIMYFAKGEYISASDVVPSSTEPGRSTVKLTDVYVPREVDEIGFKIWVEGAEGAAVAVSELAYTVSISDTSVVLDEQFSDGTGWVPEHVSFNLVGERTTLLVDEGANLGNLLHSKQYAIGEIDRIIVSVLAVQNGRVSVQFPVFDSIGTYIDSVDVIKDVGAGVHSRRLSDIAWPEQAELFVMKVWVSGANAGAALNWILLTGKGAEEASPPPVEMQKPE